MNVAYSSRIGFIQGTHGANIVLLRLAVHELLASMSLLLLLLLLFYYVISQNCTDYNNNTVLKN